MLSNHLRRAGALLAPPAFVALFIVARQVALAHEGHAALPTKGATVQGEQLLLSDAAAKAIGMTLAKVELKDLSQVVAVNARTELPWRQQAVATSLVPGRITEVLVKPGERVERGQVVAHITSRDLERLEAELREAQAELHLAAQILEQRRSLVSEGAVAGKALVDAESQHRQASAEVEIAAAKLRLIGAQNQNGDLQADRSDTIESLPIRSPISGVIAHADVRAGQVVEPDQHLFEVVDHSRLWVVGEVLEADASLVARDQSTTVTIDALPDEKLVGKIEDVDVHLDSQSRSLAVRQLFDNSNGVLRPGMTARMRIEVRRVEKAVVVPANTLIQDGAATFVLLQEGSGKFRRQPVKVGLALPDQVEITDGVFPGNRVIQTGKLILASLFARAASASQKADHSTVEIPARAIQPILVQGVAELPTDRKAYASSAIDGRLVKISVDHGQHVSAGEVLAEIQSLEVRNLQLDLIKAQIALDRARAALSRLEHAGQKTVAQKEVWKLRNENTQLETRAKGLGQQLLLAGLSQAQVDRLKEANGKQIDDVLSSIIAIRAPIDGWVASFSLVPGQVVNRDDQIFEIQDPTKIWVRGNVFERDAARVDVGDKVTVTLPGNSRFRSPGEVARISPLVGSKERTLSIWVELSNADHQLKEEMSAWIELEPRMVSARRRNPPAPALGATTTSKGD
jgi:cobalt-zinc-cadmium efflux system membrane fusion protein